MLVLQDVLEPAYRKRSTRSYAIVAPRKRASYGVSLAAVYGINRDCSASNVRSSVNSICRQWVHRLWDLGRHELWLYQRGLVPDVGLDAYKLVRAFELYADCRPRCVAYMPRPAEWKPIEYKPCNRANFCPHCWASLVARQTQRLKYLINAYIARDPKARLSVRVVTDEYFLTSAGIGGLGFAQPEERYAAIIRLRNELQKCKNHVNQNYTSTRRNTLASLYRVCAVPMHDGWRVQTRRLLLAPSDTQLSLPKMRGARRVLDTTAVARGGETWMQRKTVSTQDEDIYRALIAFHAYPAQLLNNDIELVAIYLNATARMRLIGGTGKMRRAGSALVREYVQQEKAVRDDKAAKRAQEISRN